MDIGYYWILGFPFYRQIPVFKRNAPISQYRKASTDQYQFFFLATIAKENAKDAKTEVAPVAYFVVLAA